MGFSQIFNKNARQGSSALGVASAADVQAKATQKHFDELSANGMAEEVGIIATNSAVGKSKIEIERKESKNRQTAYEQLLQAYDDARNYFDGRQRDTDKIKAEIKDLEIQRNKFIEHLQINSELLGKHEKLQRDYQSGKLDRNEAVAFAKERGLKVEKGMSDQYLMNVLLKKDKDAIADESKEVNEILDSIDGKVHDKQENVKTREQEDKTLQDEINAISTSNLPKEERTRLINEKIKNADEAETRSLRPKANNFDNGDPDGVMILKKRPVSENYDQWQQDKFIEKQVNELQSKIDEIRTKAEKEEKALGEAAKSTDESFDSEDSSLTKQSLPTPGMG